MFVINTKDNFLHLLSSDEEVKSHWCSVDDEKVQQAYGEEYLPYAPLKATCTLNAETQEWEISVDKEGLQAFIDEAAARAQAEEDARKAEEDARKAEEDARKAEISQLSTRITNAQTTANQAKTAANNAQNTANNANANYNRTQIVSSYFSCNVPYQVDTGDVWNYIISHGTASYHFPSGGGSWALLSNPGVRGGSGGVYKQISVERNTSRKDMQSNCDWCIRI